MLFWIRWIFLSVVIYSIKDNCNFFKLRKKKKPFKLTVHDLGLPCLLRIFLIIVQWAASTQGSVISTLAISLLSWRICSCYLFCPELIYSQKYGWGRDFPVAVYGTLKENYCVIKKIVLLNLIIVDIIFIICDSMKNRILYTNINNGNGKEYINLTTYVSIEMFLQF